MTSLSLALLALTLGQVETLGPGDHTRNLKMGDLKRTYLVHVPKSYDAKKPTPVVVALHGAMMNGPMMVWFSGLSKKSEQAGFIVVYPSGDSLSWNAGSFKGMTRADDVAFIGKMLDELGTLVKVDSKRVFVCGMSNGAMMSYRLAAEMSDRIAAIAPVAGTVSVKESKPKRPVPVIHFHGTKDTLVPFASGKGKGKRSGPFKTVGDSIKIWVKLDGCDETPREDVLSKKGDDMKVTRKTFTGGKNGAEVVLITIEGGGHTWPGMQPPVSFMGKSARNISANDLMWEFFLKHPMK